MLIRKVAVTLLSLAILTVGLLKRERYRSEVQILREYAFAIEQLRQEICGQKLPICTALDRAMVGRCATVQSYFEQLKRQLQQLQCGQWEEPPFPLEAYPLPIQSLSTIALNQDDILKNLVEEVRAAKQNQEKSLEGRCRSCLSVSAGLAMICAIVLF